MVICVSLTDTFAYFYDIDIILSPKNIFSLKLQAFLRKDDDFLTDIKRNSNKNGLLKMFYFLSS